LRGLYLYLNYVIIPLIEILNLLFAEISRFFAEIFITDGAEKN